MLCVVVCHYDTLCHITATYIHTRSLIAITGGAHGLSGSLTAEVWSTGAVHGCICGHKTTKRGVVYWLCSMLGLPACYTLLLRLLLLVRRVSHTLTLSVVLLTITLSVSHSHIQFTKRVANPGEMLHFHRKRVAGKRVAKGITGVGLMEPMDPGVPAAEVCESKSKSKSKTAVNR
jgi:hypothetical protein